MDTRLIFLDIDGTFIEPGRMEAPASAVEAVRAAQANGHRVFLCTGRNYRMTSPVLRYGFDGYVCSAGGYVVCGQEVLFDCPMDKAQSDGVRAILEANGVECTLEARDATYGGAQMMERLSAYQARQPGGLNSEMERWRRAFADGMLIRPLEEYQGEPIYKICYIAPGQKALAPARAAYEDQFVFCEGAARPSGRALSAASSSTASSTRGRPSSASAPIWGCPRRPPSPLGTAPTTWKWPMWPGSATA